MSRFPPMCKRVYTCAVSSIVLCVLYIPNVCWVSCNYFFSPPSGGRSACAGVYLLSSGFTTECLFGMWAKIWMSCLFLQAEAQKEKDEAEVQVNCNLSAAAEILFILDSLWESYGKRPTVEGLFNSCEASQEWWRKRPSSGGPTGCWSWPCGLFWTFQTWQCSILLLIPVQ